MYGRVEGFIDKVKKEGISEVFFDVLLSQICTFRIGGAAKLVLAPESADEVIRCVQKLRKFGVAYLVIGSASNLLFDDRGFDGAVIRTYKLKGVRFSEGVVIADAGVSLSYLCRFAAMHGLFGLHGLCGIPGTVGGSVITAAGAFGCNIYDHICGVTVYLPDEDRIASIPLGAADFSYRKSPDTLKDAVILNVSFKLPSGERTDIEERMSLCQEKRRLTQPHGAASAGSYFKRPDGAPPAAYLIDRAGLKGMRIGDAVVSEKHAGFIVNIGNATALDVLRLAERVKETVFCKFGVLLTEEVRKIPFEFNY